MKHFYTMTALVCVATLARAQSKDSATARALTLPEYEHARTLSIPDLDKDSYMKFENTWILDRNDYGKPYFITGDDGLRKRIDLYKLILKEGRVEIGTVIYYTTETGKRYTACLPGFKADAKVWGKYFEDIHAIDKEEKNFVLKLSYVLSKELGYQLYHAAAAAQGKDVSKEREGGAYGIDICFPGDQPVTLADGHTKPIAEIRPGDRILSVDPASRVAHAVRVESLTVHEARNYAITHLLMVAAEERGDGIAKRERSGGGRESGSPTSLDGHEVRLYTHWLAATPNHPLIAKDGAGKEIPKRAGEVQEGDVLVGCDGSGALHDYRIWYKTESADGRKPVYNIVTAGNGAAEGKGRAGKPVTAGRKTLLIDGMVVSEKPVE